MFHQTVRQKKILNRCVINRDVKRMKYREPTRTDAFFLGGFVFFMLAWLIRVNFNV